MPCYTGFKEVAQESTTYSTIRGNDYYQENHREFEPPILTISTSIGLRRHVNDTVVLQCDIMTIVDVSSLMRSRYG